ncbi:hypothetical protein GCM10023259_082900 [Thermocatellispora tengchongensis]
MDRGALQNLAEQGVCDFRMSGRTVQVFNPAARPGVRAWPGGPVVRARHRRGTRRKAPWRTPHRRCWWSATTGSSRCSPTSPQCNRGAWEQYIGAGGVSDEGTATLLAQSVGSKRLAAPDLLAPIRAARLDPVRVLGRRMSVEWQRVSAERLLAPTFEMKPPATSVGMRPLTT